MATHVTSPERYELIDRIAVGGMAEVFRAVAYGSHGFEKTLAIKRILPELAQDPEFEDRFIGEAKLAVKLSHANVVQVLDFGRLAGTLFIAMELVDGLDLAALLRRYKEAGKPLPLPAAFHMAIEIARGLAFAHSHGVVHRDVSPSNILVSRAGEVKIADFGIAHAAGDLRAAAADRRRIMGKWRYMSPEQARGAALKTSSDIFSAASVMFELFTGDKLFPGDEAEQIIDHIARMPIPAASERRAGLPPRLDEVLRSALERDPAARPAAADLLRALVEISYESSIVVSALDVSAAIGEVLVAGATNGAAPAAASGGKGIDAIIRQQLASGAVPAPDGEGATSAEVTADGGRRTAVAPPPAEALEGTNDAFADTAHAGTLVRRGVDADGITRWEMDETVAAGPHARRGEKPAEVAASRSRAAARRRALLLGFGAVALAAGGAGAYRLAGGGGDDGGDGGGRRVVAALDAGLEVPRPAMVSIASIPPGARVRLDGRALPEVTPTVALVEPDHPHRVDVGLEGYAPWSEEVSGAAGERVKIVAPLVARRAALVVTTRPPGASVLLDGEEIGVTPLRREDLRPGAGRALVLRKIDHRPVTLTVDLAEGRPVEIDRRLDSTVAYGKINLNIKDSWADVWLGSKSVGRAPGTLRLPVGRHRLRLMNSVSKKSKYVTVDVTADTVATYEFDL